MRASPTSRSSACSSSVSSEAKRCDNTVAAAAATVLSHLFASDDTLELHALEREVGDARIAAGVAYRSDVEAGYAIGRAVASRAIARARSDGGASTTWTGTIPTDAW